MSQTETLTVDTDPDPKDVRLLEHSVNILGAQLTGFYDYLPLSILVRGERGSVEAGLYGFSWGGCCEVKSLWVDEARRGHGLGTRLLQTAETEARTRGCDLVVLDTHSFQAPDFYRKLGYEVVGVVEGYPRGEQKLTFRKPLV